MKNSFLRRITSAVVWYTLLGLTAPAQANNDLNFNNLLHLAWETSWSQGGTPMIMVKWTQPIRLRIFGDMASKWRSAVVRDMDEISALTGKPYVLLESSDETANFSVEVVRESPKTPNSLPCFSSNQWNNAGLNKVHVMIRDADARRCITHELVHAWGLQGHPLGNTVLTYFNAPLQLTNYDHFMLEALYSSELPHGATPFSWMALVIEKYRANFFEADFKDQLRIHEHAFRDSLLKEMTDYANGKIQAPSIVYRSGRVSTAAVENGRAQMALYLGVAFQHGQWFEASNKKALEFFTNAANKGLLNAQLRLARLYLLPDPDVRNLEQAYLWFRCAQSNGAGMLGNMIATLEKDLPAEGMAATKEKVATLLTSGQCLKR